MSLDHVVIAASSLDTGSPVLERALNVPLSGGGQHTKMGTHNRLLRLGADAYLELIAVDPEGRRPERPRWFTLDQPATHALLREGPRLVHWVAHVESTALPRLPFDVGPWEFFQRGDLSWQLTVRGDGMLPADGIVPSLICWSGPAHPSARLPDAGVTIEGLELEHPNAAAVQRQLDLLRLPYRCTAAPVPRLTAHLLTPAGPRTLRSTEPIR
ncbi:MAG TPA: VOC family protein [Myxococcaceae bacterium]|nr:VOC family protein [Myxococcaceae bacterium]